MFDFIFVFFTFCTLICIFLFRITSYYPLNFCFNRLFTKKQKRLSFYFSLQFLWTRDFVDFNFFEVDKFRFQFLWTSFFLKSIEVHKIWSDFEVLDSDLNVEKNSRNCFTLKCFSTKTIKKGLLVCRDLRRGSRYTNFGFFFFEVSELFHSSFDYLRNNSINYWKMKWVLLLLSRNIRYLRGQKIVMMFFCDFCPLYQ